jgi:hypothetical protein
VDIQFTIETTDQAEIREAIAMLEALDKANLRPVLGTSQDVAVVPSHFVGFDKASGQDASATVVREGNKVVAVEVSAPAPAPAISVSDADITRQLIAKKGAAFVATLVKEHGAPRVSELSPEGRAAFLKTAIGIIEVQG